MSRGRGRDMGRGRDRDMGRGRDMGNPETWVTHRSGEAAGQGNRQKG